MAEYRLLKDFLANSKYKSSQNVPANTVYVWNGCGYNPEHGGIVLEKCVVEGNPEWFEEIVPEAQEFTETDMLEYADWHKCRSNAKLEITFDEFLRMKGYKQ